MEEISGKSINKRWRIIIAILVVIVLIVPLIVYVACNLIKERPNETVMIEMSDGVRLATDVYLPKGEGPFPVILYRTPYDKNSDMGPIDLREYGIAIVTQDSRGCHASEGEYAAFGTDGSDAYDTVEWLKTQSWFNGRYATYGGSARGITQYMQVPYLTDIGAQFIEVATPDLYSQALYQGGATRKMLAENWLNGIDHGDYYYTIFDGIASDSEFAVSHRIDPTEFSNVTWPAIHRGGWYDCFGQGTIDGFMGYQYGGGEGGMGNSKLIMGPWTHAICHPEVGELTFPENARTTPYWSELFNGMFGEALLNTTQYGDWRSVPNAIYYVMGDTDVTSPYWNRWATSDVWPVPYSDQCLYLQGDNTLSASASSSYREYSYDYDPHNPVTTLGGANLLTTNRGAYDQRAIESGRSDIVSFDYRVTEPLLITGRISAVIYVTSDCIDTDFTVKLMDVYPDGREINIADGIVRMRYRNGMDTAEFMDGSGETVYQAAIDLWSTSYYFSEGHNLKISISSSNYPRFDVNTNTGGDITSVTESTPYIIANNSIIISSEYPSRLILPVPTAAPNYVNG